MTDIGVGLLGYAFMGKAHINAYKKLAYMVYRPPAQPRLVAITGRQEEAVSEAAQRYGFSTYYTDWRRLVADPAVELFDNGGPNDIHAALSAVVQQFGCRVGCQEWVVPSRDNQAKLYRDEPRSLMFLGCRSAKMHRLASPLDLLIDLATAVSLS
jgi:hypothetical protein